MFYLQKYAYGILKFVAPENLLYAQVVILPIFVIVILQKTQLDLFRNKFVHIKCNYTQKATSRSSSTEYEQILFDEMRTKAREWLRITLV